MLNNSSFRIKSARYTLDKFIILKGQLIKAGIDSHTLPEKPEEVK